MIRTIKEFKLFAFYSLILEQRGLPRLPKEDIEFDFQGILDDKFWYAHNVYLYE